MKTTTVFLAAVMFFTLAVRAQVVSDGATNTLSNVTNTISGDVTVGTNGSFTLLILSDNVLLTNSANGVIGRNVTARSNEVQLVSSSARWRMGGSLFVGSNGALSRLVVSNGAFVDNNNGSLATRMESSNNVALVTGAGSIWSNRNDLNIGGAGRDNQLIVSNGGWVVSRTATVGLNPSASNNLALVTGTGSVWSNVLNFTVGALGPSNRLIIQAGGLVFSDSATVGDLSSASNNEALVTGSGSVWTNRTFLTIGSQMIRNLLVVSNGATVWSGTGVIGGTSVAPSNQVIVTGTGSVWSNQTDLFVGSSSSGNRADVNNGGGIVTSNGTIGSGFSAHSNTVVLTGSGSVWNSRNNLIVGDGGSGNVLIASNGGVVSVRGSLIVGRNQTTSSGNRLVVDGGSVLVTNGGTGVLEIRVGTNILNAGLIDADIFRITNSGARFQFNGGMLSAKSSRVSIANPLIIGNGISPATFNLAGNGTHDFTGTLGLIITNNATLSGNGALVAQLQVRAGAQLAPGKISLSTPPLLSGTIVLELARNGAVLTNDQIQVTGTLTYGGALIVTNFGPTALTAGDKFQLFTASAFAGSFTTTSLPPLNPGLSWVNNLGVDGSIEVFASPPIGGSALSFDGTNDFVLVSNDGHFNALPLVATTWINTTQATGEVGIINKYVAGSLNGWQVGLVNGQVRAWYIRDGANNVWDGALGLNGGPVTDGEWHHLAFTIDNAGGRLYVDGFLRDTRAWTGTAGSCTTTQELAFARYPGGAGEFFQGTMDETAIWSGLQQTSGEIKTNLTRGLIGSEPGVVLYQRMNEGTGVFSGNASPVTGTLGRGILQNGVLWVPGIILRPAILTKNPDTITANSARLRGETNPTLTNTTAWFEWGTNTSYGNVTLIQSVGSGSANTNFSQSIDSLTEGITYHYRAVASNMAGASFGADKSFFTTGTNMLAARWRGTATLLPNGKVLAAGGLDKEINTLSTAELFDPATGTWTATGPMTTARYDHAAILLPNGKVLLSGGRSNQLIHTSAELYDPATGTWTLTGSLGTNRYSHTATLLSNGKVLVAAGLGPAGAPTSVHLTISELYDPPTETWTPSGAMITGRFQHTASLLPNGKVLVTGGSSNFVALSSAELYDPATAIWSPTGSMNSNRVNHTATLLPNGKTLVAGGFGTGSTVRVAELYDPVAETWTVTGQLSSGHYDHTASLLPNGKVFVANGASGSEIGELYDSSSGTWTNFAGLVSRADGTATVLPNGKVLIAGGVSLETTTSAQLLEFDSGTWSVTGSMTYSHNDHTATLLPDARVLVAGFTNGQVYNPISGTWTNTPPLNTGRNSHRATLLPDGRVLVSGGFINGFFGGVGTSELFNPATGTWTNSGSLNTIRGAHTATLLANGKVLVAGGVTNGFSFDAPLRSAELYDPAAGTWVFIGSLASNRLGHTATLLPNGKVLVAGGVRDNFSPATASAELFDPISGTWTNTGSMNVGRSAHIAKLLPNGTVLVAGGGGSAGFLSSLASAELYDPATGTWTLTGSMTNARVSLTATLLPNGKVLAMKGYNLGHLSSAELYDPATKSWTSTAGSSATALLPTATLLANGKVLVTGGSTPGGSTNRAELYDVGQGFNSSWQPRITAVTSPLATGGSLTINGSKFRGLSEASGGNAGQNSSTDYPLVQLLSVEGEQTLFLSSTNWSTNSFISTPLSPFPSGWTRATVFVNGISSTSAVLRIAASAVVTLGNLTQNYDGTARVVTVSTAPPGLPVTLTYNGSTSAPTNAGSYTVIALVTDLNYQGGATNTLIVNPIAANVTLDNLSQSFDGTSRIVSVNTVPPGLTVSVTYNGSSTPPTNAGSYTVIATVTTPNYSGSVTNTLEVAHGLYVNTAQGLRTVDARLFGVNAAAWDGYLDTVATDSALAELGTRVLRWPGGSWGDIYHESSPPNAAGWGSFTTNFIRVTTNAHAQAFMIANYGTGTTNEAADWVRFVNVTNNAGFKYWEVGNECFGSWEADDNTNAPFKPHDPWTYATRFKDYYSAMKAVDPTIKIGVPVAVGEDAFFGTNFVFNPRTGQPHFGWTPILLNTLSNLGVMPDFAVDHFYAQFGNNNDARLLQASTNWAVRAANLRQQLADYLGTTHTNIELVCTENNSDSASSGKQTTSLVNGLYLADSFSQIMKTEFNAFLWFDLRNGPDTNGSFSPSLYGWRTNGDQGIILEADTRYPTFYGMKLMQYLAKPGDTTLNPVSSDPLLAVYAAKTANGAVNVLVINKNPTNTLSRPLILAGYVPSATATRRFYGIPQDEAARTNAPLAQQDIATGIAAVSNGFTNAYPPYSLTLFNLSPAAPSLTIQKVLGTSSSLAFQLQGQPGVPYIIQTSSNLVQWSSVTTNVLTGSTLNFTNAIAPNVPVRFWRALWQP